MVRYIPWGKVKSWQCLACGSCCRKFAIDLTPKEYRKIGRLWPQRVRIKRKRPYLKREVDGRCKFLFGKLCQLQMLNMKPFVCKMWPFKILLKPDKMDKDFKGLYPTAGKEYFVYLNPKCSGINRGNPADFKKTIQEIINLQNGLKEKQYYSTSKAYLNQVSLYNAQKEEEKICLRG